MSIFAISLTTFIIYLYICVLKLVKYLIMEKNLNRIKAVLADKQKTNRWLAEQLGRDQATVSKWCTNACQPPMETFMKIAQLLKVGLDELVRYEQVPISVKDVSAGNKK